MKYTVSIAVDGRVDVEVDAANPAAAKELAMSEFANADLTEMDVVGFHAVNATDENDEITDF